MKQAIHKTSVIWRTFLSRYLSRKSSRKDLPFLKAPATERITTFLSLTSSDNSIS